jgi:hypothetical protein
MRPGKAILPDSIYDRHKDKQQLEKIIKEYTEK